jgi:D-alanyl-D-alanine carboxypeptidase
MVLAEGIGGSVERFAELMTKKAREIGAINTNFTNPHGLTAADHYSTAKDLTLIFRYAMRNPAFREIVQTKISSVSSTTVVRKKNVLRRISVRNHNRLLWNFEGAIGGKTGYTAAAQKCFVGAVQRGGVTLIVAILGARDQWGDTRSLLEYGFENYQTLSAAASPVPKRGTGERVNTRSENPLASAATPQAIYSAAPSSDGYILQIGTFRELQRAQSLSKDFNEKGFETFVEKIAIDRNQAAYRVRVGPYADWLEAQEVAHEVLTRSGHQAVILPFTPPRESHGDAG